MSKTKLCTNGRKDDVIKDMQNIDAIKVQLTKAESREMDKKIERSKKRDIRLLNKLAKELGYEITKKDKKSIRVKSKKNSTKEWQKYVRQQIKEQDASN